MKEKTVKYQKWLNKKAPDMTGLTALVTGANSGIGFAAATAYAYRGAYVILACRNPARAETAMAKIREMIPCAKLSFMQVDLASFASMDAFGRQLKEDAIALDVCLHCAGVYYPRATHTEDGYPMTEGVNYVGTTYLADVILPFMKPCGRMIFTSSLVDRFGHPDRHAKDEGYGAYARSKTLLSAEVLRRAATQERENIDFIVVHPGITATDLLSPDKTTHKPFFSRLGHAFLYIFTHKPEKAALTAVYALREDVKNGEVIGPRGIFGISGYPHKTKFAPRVRHTYSGKIKIKTPIVQSDIKAEKNGGKRGTTP